MKNYIFGMLFKKLTNTLNKTKFITFCQIDLKHPV